MLLHQQPVREKLKNLPSTIHIKRYNDNQICKSYFNFIMSFDLGLGSVGNLSIALTTEDEREQGNSCTWKVVITRLKLN